MGTVKDSFDAMKNRFNPEKAAGTTAVIQYDIKGDEGGAWHVTIKDCTCTVTPGPAENPDLALEISAKDWFDMASGKTTGATLLMMGKLKLKGDMGLAMKLRSLFPA
jgi:putative sterol carrier protein